VNPQQHKDRVEHDSHEVSTQPDQDINSSTHCHQDIEDDLHEGSTQYDHEIEDNSHEVSSQLEQETENTTIQEFKGSTQVDQEEIEERLTGIQDSNTSTAYCDQEQCPSPPCASPELSAVLAGLGLKSPCV
jgi:hypothetical protein